MCWQVTGRERVLQVFFCVSFELICPASHLTFSKILFFLAVVFDVWAATWTFIQDADCLSSHFSSCKLDNKTFLCLQLYVFPFIEYFALIIYVPLLLPPDHEDQSKAEIRTTFLVFWEQLLQIVVARVRQQLKHLESLSLWYTHQYLQYEVASEWATQGYDVSLFYSSHNYKLRMVVCVCVQQCT